MLQQRHANRFPHPHDIMQAASRARGMATRRAIIAMIADGSATTAPAIAAKLGHDDGATRVHLRRLVNCGAITSSGKRRPVYSIAREIEDHAS